MVDIPPGDRAPDLVDAAPDVVDAPVEVIDAASEVADAAAEVAPDARPKGVFRVGGPLGEGLGLAGAYFPKIAVDRSGRPWVVFIGATTTNVGVSGRVYLQRWDGAAWQTVGMFEPGADSAVNQPELELDAQDGPVVVWTDASRTGGPYVIRVRRRIGDRWEVWDDLPPGSYPSLAVDGQRVSLVATFRAEADSVRVYRREAQGWSPLGDALSAPGIQVSRVPIMAGNAAGVLEVLWCEQEPFVQFVPQRRRWDGGAWSVRPKPPSGAFGLAGIKIAMNAAGVVAFGWTESELTIPLEYTAAVFVDGWSERQLSPQRKDVSVSAVVLDDMRRPLVALSRGVSRTLVVDRWSGSAWEDLSGPLQGTSIPSSGQLADLALDAEGHWYVAFQESKGPMGQGTDVYVMTGDQ